MIWIERNYFEHPSVPVSERVQRHEDVLGVDGLLLLVVAHLVGLRAEQVDELGAASQDQFAGVVRHADVGAQLLHHLKKKREW